MLYTDICNYYCWKMASSEACSATNHGELPRAGATTDAGSGGGFGVGGVATVAADAPFGVTGGDTGGLGVTTGDADAKGALLRGELAGASWNSRR
mmetsp:Transcript_123362/g.193540  ORF Transcript_123362/g.193540 Transcript_123362/m.193540 type:complete len:95 (+) Transcript_123362:71-355(+)